jgi:hypothetical protein|tara:strand:+ start:360 stop:1883 length:1524 start_codon:yes stop_codon:yes gene_type:complete
MSDQEYDLKKENSGGVSGIGNNDFLTMEGLSLEEQFKKRSSRLREVELESSNAYQSHEISSPLEENDPAKALGGLDDFDKSDFGYVSEPEAFKPTRPKVDVVKLDFAKVYGGAPAVVAFESTRPKVEVVRLDPSKIYLPKEDELGVPVDGIDGESEVGDEAIGKMGEAEEEAIPFAEVTEPSFVENEGEPEKEVIKAEEPELIKVDFRAPKVSPVLLKREEIYVVEEEKPKPDLVKDNFSQIDQDPVPREALEEDLEKATTALKSSKVEEMEVMNLENKDATSLSQSGTSEKEVSKWAFWRRPSKRDRQLTRISEGYLEMVDLVRAVRGQLESQNENNIILRDSLAHLPEAMKGFDSFSESQHIVGEALRDIHGQIKQYNSKDEKLAESMNGFNDTLKGMDDTSKATIQTFDRVQERMRDSDIRMENLFQNVQNTEEKVSDTMVRLQRNMGIMQSIFLICLMIVIGALIFTLMVSKADKEVPAPVREIVIETPAAASGSDPSPNERD